MTPLWFDCETYNETPISRGTYAYAETCEVEIITFALGDDPVTTIDVHNGGDLGPLFEAMATADYMVAHNAMFDRNVLRLGNLGIHTEREFWRCSMVRALAHGLPGGLDKIGHILGIPEDKKKLAEGKELVKFFCQPRPKGQKLRRATKDTHPEKWARYLEYAAHDIEAMRACCKLMPSGNYTFEPDGDRPRDKELRLWHLDQKINDRGYRIDIPLVNECLRAVEQEQARLKAHTQDITEYDEDEGIGLASTTQRDAMLAFLLLEHGVDLPDLRASTLERRLGDESIPEIVKELIRVRLQVSSTSTSKYKVLKRGVTQGDRMRGTIQFDGAARTRRAAGRTFQPQNLPSRGLLEQDQIDFGIEALMARVEDLTIDNVMLLATSAIRSCIVAPPGKKLVVADKSNIEGRGLAWLAGEQWKLDAFREFDVVMGTDGVWHSGDQVRDAALAGRPIELATDEKGELIHRGPDLYKLAYAKSFATSPDKVTKAGRQIGKVQELAFGYQGGISAGITFADAYGMDLDDMADAAWDTLPVDVRKESSDFVDWLASKGTTYPISHRAAVTIDVFKRLWRGAHPNVVALWDGLQKLFRDATQAPGETLRYGLFSARRDGKWLRIVLPSGRALCYPDPKVHEDGSLSYMGVDQYTRKWKRVKTYGGKLVENATQAFARDDLFDDMPTIEAAGYEIVLHVHDEVITEVPDTPEFNAVYLGALMSVPPPYAPDLPLAAAGFESYRYKKG